MIENVKEQKMQVSTDDQFDGPARYKRLSKAWMPVWVMNAVENYFKFKWYFPTGLAKCILQEKKGSGPALIIGSGATLDDALPLLKEWKGVVFACASNAKTLIKFGCYPKYAIVYDCHPVAMFNKVKDFNWKGVCLIGHPCIDFKIVEYWYSRKWRSLWFKVNQPMSCLHNEVLPIIFNKWIKVSFVSSGSSLGTAIQAAHLLGYGPLVLVGGDMCFAGGIRSATQWDFDTKKKIWYPIKPLPIPWDQNIIKYRNGEITSEEMVDYKIGIYAVAYSLKLQLLSCSEHTIMDDIPYVNLKTVMRNQDDLSKWVISKEKVRDSLISFLEYHKIVIKNKNGLETSKGQDKEVKSGPTPELIREKFKERMIEKEKLEE